MKKDKKDHSALRPSEGLRERKDEEYPEWIRAAAFTVTGVEVGSDKLFPTPFGDKTRLGIIRNINACFVGNINESQFKRTYKSDHLNDIFKKPTAVAADNIWLSRLGETVGDEMIWWTEDA